MTHTHADLRVKRTHLFVRNALIALLSEKSFEAITVGEIAERAMINRATFYRHYQDKYDLVTRLFQEAVDALVIELGPPLTDPTTIDLAHLPETWIRLFEYFARHAGLYQALLGRSGSLWFVAKVRDSIAEVIRERLQVSRKERASGNMPEEVAIAFVANFSVSVLSWWLDSGMPYAPHQMATWVLHFLMHGYFHALGFQVPLSPTEN
jgi:AcrR family transcriptional regulator